MSVVQHVEVPHARASMGTWAEAFAAATDWRSLYEEYLRSDHWRGTRDVAIVRANRRCQSPTCRNALLRSMTDDEVAEYRRLRLEVHHLTYERLGREHPDDLIVLCDDCHDVVHQVDAAPSGLRGAVLNIVTKLERRTVPMNQLTTSSPTSSVVPATPQKRPQLSASLTVVLERALNAHPDLRMRDAPLPEFLRSEAQGVVARYDQLSKPADRSRITAWLVGVNAGMAKPLSQNEFLVRATEIVDAVAAMPADVFTGASRREAQLTFQWFPGVKEVYDLLWPLALPILTRRTALHALLDAKQIAQAERDALTDEQRDQILSDFRAKMAAQQRPATRAMVLGRAAPVNHAHLVAIYRDQLRQAEAADNVLLRNITLARLRSLAPEEEFA